MGVPDARLSWRQDLDIQGGASRQLTVAGQEYRDVVFDRRSKVYCVWRFETVPDSNLGGLFDHRRANFRQNQSTLGEKSVVLCEEGLVTLSQWLTRHSIRDRREVKISVPAPVLKPQWRWMAVTAAS